MKARMTIFEWVLTIDGLVCSMGLGSCGLAFLSHIAGKEPNMIGLQAICALTYVVLFVGCDAKTKLDEITGVHEYDGKHTA